MDPIQELAITKWDNVYHLFNMKVEEASPEYSRVSMPIEPKACNGMGFVHGGVLFALGDIAFGAAGHADKIKAVPMSVMAKRYADGEI